MAAPSQAPLFDRFGIDETAADAIAEALGQSGGLREVFDALRGGATMSQAMGLPPGTARLIYAQAFARFNAGDHERAMLLFQALCVLEPNSVDNWLGFGISARIRNEMDVADKAFEIALGLAPMSAPALYHRAELLAQTGRAKEARACLERFVGAAETNAKAQLRPEAERLALALSG